MASQWTIKMVKNHPTQNSLLHTSASGSLKSQEEKERKTLA